MGSKGRTGEGSLLDSHSSTTHIVVNSLLYFVNNALTIRNTSPCDPVIPTELTEWICDNLADYYSEEKKIEAIDKLFDDRSPWMNRDLRAIRNKRKNDKSNLLHKIDEGCWIINGILCCKSMKDRVVLFATIDTDFPAFKDKCPDNDKSTSTDELHTGPFTCPCPSAMEFSDEKLITGKDLTGILNELKHIRNLCMKNANKTQAPVPVRPTYAHASKVQPPKTELLPVPISPGPSLITEAPWIPVTRKKRTTTKRTTATIRSSNSTLLAATVTRPFGIFVSRLSSTTTEDNLKKFLSEKNLDVMNVEKLPTKYDTYASFHVNVNIGNQTANEILNPSFWPNRVLVRKYYATKPTRSIQ